MAKDAEVAANYRIKIPLKHLLSVLRIAELIEGDISCAMEVVDDETACCFFFTKSRDFTFNIGVGSVGFENLDGEYIS